MAQLGNDNRSKWDPAYCKQLIEHMAAGCSFASFGGKIGVRYSTLKRWEKNHAEFAEASEIGQLVCMYTWEKIIVGQANGSVKGLPATTIFALKNYFPDRFKENLQLQGNGNTIVVFDSGVPVKPDQLKRENLKEIGEAEYKTIENSNSPRHRDESSIEKIEKKSSVLPDFLENSPLNDENSISEDDI